MRIENAKGRAVNSGYQRLFANEKLGALFSKAQATVIANGNELERIILSKSVQILDLEKFIDDVTDGGVKNGVFVCAKRVIKKSKYAIDGIEPDLLIFIVQKRRVCKVIELKDGDSFDTKKSSGERENLEKFSTEFGAKIPFVAEYFICCFNQLDKEAIRTGFKERFDLAHIMNGKELCDILGINYEQIVEERLRDSRQNFEYFLNELIKIEEVKAYLAPNFNE